MQPRPGVVENGVILKWIRREALTWLECIQGWQELAERALDGRRASPPQTSVFDALQTRRVRR